jgi:tetratricopeptide (TPR) repeat protein
MIRDRLVPGLALLVLSLAGTGCESTVDHLKANFAAKQGNDLYKAQDYQKATEWYRYSLYLNPELPIAYHNAGLAFMALYKPGSKHPKDLYYSQQAIDHLTRFLIYEPDDEDAKNQLLTVYLSAERYEDAAKFFEEEFKKRSSDPAVASRLAQILGMVYAKKGDFESSLEWYKKRAEIEKDNPEALYTIGVLCWDKVYKAGITMDLEKRKELVEMGMDYLKRAAELREDYFEATSYINLMYRQKAILAQMAGNMEDFQKFTEEADKLARLSLEQRKKVMAKKG